MTSHPKDLTEDVIDALALNSHFSRHLHLPLQSGSNKILGLMNRKYTKEKYSEIAAYAREKIKDLTLTSDIIIGFPGETQEDFEETFSFVKETRFTSLFTFIYSPRAGTTASKIPDLTPRHEKVLRLQKIIKLQESISEEIFSRMIGKNYKILIEFCKNGFTAGRTGGNIIIKIKKEFPSLTGEFVKCKITAAERSVLFGEIYLYQ
jgi:tRNA-2-methylthio-N6-dimethylallyladenosine synthase